MIIPTLTRQTAAVAILILMSGNPVILAPAHQTAVLILVLFVLCVWLFLRRELGEFDLASLAVFVSFVAVIGVQSIQLSTFPIVTLGGFAVRLLIALLAQRLIDDFPRAFVGAMRFLVIFSAPFYLATLTANLFGIDIYSMLEPLNLYHDAEGRTASFVHIGLHNFGIPEEYYRNAGMFWEPGAMSGYCLLALLVKGLVRGRKFPRWSTAVLSLGVLSTASTTGYVLLPLALMWNIDYRRAMASGKTILIGGRRLPPVILVVPAVTLILAGAAWVATSDIEFIDEKINHQLEGALNETEGYQITRFGAIAFNWAYIVERPLTGWGLNNETRYALDPTASDAVIEAQGNGLFDFLAKLGFVGLLTWCGAVSYRVLRGGVTLVRAAIFVSLALLVLNGELFLNFPLYLSLMFMRLSPGESMVAAREVQPVRLRNAREAMY